ncbi:hypothetical protein G9A89_004730 [Geosiphon pyriformis]|nr:hypothetical protein G9A89_004730 [Geosiphon pyriformis]
MQAIPYFLKDTANSWYQSLINKPQNFNAFKVKFLRYFSNNNSINHLVNIFTTMKQGETKAVTTYLRCFHRNLCQIQAIDTNYFTAPQIFNQFIHGLRSSILQHIHPLHSDTLQDTVTYVRNFESAESEANHTQAINLVMNKSSELNSKLKQFTIQETTIISKIKCIPQHCPISNGSQRCVFVTTVKPRLPISNSKISTKSGTISKHLPANNAVANLSSTSISDSSLSTTATSNISTTATSNLSTPINSDTTPEFTMVVHQLIPSFSNSPSGSCSWNLGTGATQNPNSQNYLSLLVISKDTTTNNSGSNQQQALTNNIPPATVINNELLVAIFLFDLEETIEISLFSGAALEEKPITTIYTDAKIDGYAIKLILDSGSAGSIITRQFMNQLGHRVDQAASARIITADGAIKTPIGEIDNLPIKINSITVPIKYQAHVGNNWLSKTNTVLDWTMQELQLSQNGQHIRTPATCNHFKPSNDQLLIEFKKETRKLTWEAYQVSWANEDHNELPPILS